MKYIRFQHQISVLIYMIRIYIQIFKFQTMMKILMVFCYAVIQATSYIDIPLSVKRQGNDISYLIPMKVNDIDYEMAISMENKDHNGQEDGQAWEFIRDYKEKKRQIQGQKIQKKDKKHKKKELEEQELEEQQEDQEEEQMNGILKASSLEGYSFEGWKRFFMEVFLWVEQRYSHDIKIDLSDVQTRKFILKNGENKQDSLQTSKTPKEKDGRITFGPNILQNKIYQKIKAQTEFIQKDVFSIYRGINDKSTRIQLGGYEQSYARGHSTGVLFYQMDLKTDDGKWKIPIKSIYCTRQKTGKDDNFFIGKDEIELSLSIQSPLLKLPQKYAEGLQRNFQGINTQCSITSSRRLMCKNMTSIDLALNYIQLKIDDGVFINISLYDLKDTYIEETKQIYFFIEFTQNEDQYQLGQPFFRSFYVSVDMEQKQMLFSPLNRFPSEYFGVYLVRIFIGFVIFTVVVAVIVMIWSFFGDPFRKNRISYGEDGVKLVSYQKPNTFDEITD